jgi:hypothetical protein
MGVNLDMLENNMKCSDMMQKKVNGFRRRIWIRKQ